MRPVQTWILFGLCLAVVVAAMGYVSLLALRLDRAEADARRQAAVEENVRLALWRMDSAVAPLVAEENGQPYFSYRSFYPAGRAYNKMFQELEHGEVVVPSPLLTQEAPQVLIHFQFGPDGALTSPEVPTGNERDLAETGYATHDKIETAAARLVALKGVVSRERLLARLPAPRAEEAAEQQLAQVRQQAMQVAAQTDTGLVLHQQSPSAQPNQATGAQGGQSAPQVIGQQADQQTLRNISEFARRFRDNYEQQRKAGQKGASSALNIQEGRMQPLWFGQTLVLARRVLANGGEYVQGCSLHWAGIRQDLLERVRDLLPEAALEPLADGGHFEGERMLAAVPVRLVPGTLPAAPEPWLSPIRLSLVIAWGCVLVAAAAVGVLLRGAVTLSERRGAFVSAVTHELRTPLTTFRMYSEMLAEGMVAGEEKRREYLGTLRGEAERLSHLVSNVLAYSRLERGRAARLEDLPVRALLNRVRDRLAGRAAQAEMDFVVEAEEAALDATVRTDPGAVEQILFNLVDNACKYAAMAADRRIHLTAGRTDSQALIRICDHGPGVALGDRRRLFRPFSKSAREAANSAPGVGLGLALSRRLARAMGGDLCLDEEVRGGACFLLGIPLGEDAAGKPAG